MNTSSTNNHTCEQTCFECAICMDDININTNFTVTECGHRFHSSCMFSNMEHRTECPICRRELVEEKETDEDEDEEEDDEDYEDDEEEDIEMKISCKQIAQKLESMNFKLEDLLSIFIEQQSLNSKDKEKFNIDFVMNLENTIEKIMDGEIAVNYCDTRSYATVLKSNISM